jgi:hypothetical protein
MLGRIGVAPEDPQIFAAGPADDRLRVIVGMVQNPVVADIERTKERTFSLALPDPSMTFALPSDARTGQSGAPSWQVFNTRISRLQRSRRSSPREC